MKPKCRAFWFDDYTYFMEGKRILRVSNSFKYTDWKDIKGWAEIVPWVGF